MSAAARLLLAALALGAACGAGAADLSALAALRVATAAERIGKLQAQAALGILPDRARRSLAEAQRELGEALASARAGPARDDDLLLRLLWRDWQAILGRPATREAAREASDRIEEMSWVALRATDRAPGAPPAALRAERAALLSQRLARLWLLRSGGVRDAGAVRAAALAGEQLVAALRALREEASDSAAVLGELQVAEGQLRFLTAAAQEIDASRGGARAAETVAKTGDHLLESMRRVGRLAAPR